MVGDAEWLLRLGWQTAVVEEDVGVYRVDIAHTRMRAFKTESYATGFSPARALAHARALMEESLSAVPDSPGGGVYHVTIFKTRYAGVYEGGRWAAFPLDHERIPAAATGSDVSCASWWSEPSVAVGTGGTPDRALAALRGVIDQCAHPGGLRQPVPAGFFCGYCNQLQKEPRT